MEPVYGIYDTRRNSWLLSEAQVEANYLPIGFISREAAEDYLGHVRQSVVPAENFGIDPQRWEVRALDSVPLGVATICF